jgi:uncharacterized protein with FMN-binding domain
MKRSVIVTSATAVGLTGVMLFHTAPVGMTVGALPTSAGASTGTGATTTTPTTVPATTSTVAAAPPPKSKSPTTTTTPTTTTAPTTTTTANSGTRSVIGEAVNYYFGVLSVKVVATGSKITSVTISTLQDGGNYRSQSIDQQSIPMLEQESMRAQSANIQSISGASYTSAGFAQSLQSALKKLGL